MWHCLFMLEEKLYLLLSIVSQIKRRSFWVVVINLWLEMILIDWVNSWIEIPISSNRSNAPLQLVECIVDNTRCPLKLAWITHLATSASLISPIKIISGSHLNIALNELT